MRLYLQTLTINIDERNLIRDQVDTEPSALDVEETMTIGGNVFYEKKDGTIRISGFNPNGIQVNQLESQLQHYIDIQCYSETNLNTLGPIVRKSLFDQTIKMDRNSKSVWSSSDIPKDGYFKPGSTSIVTRGKTSSRVKESGTDNLGRWCYQVLDGKGDRDVLLVSIYQSCKSSNKEGILTAHHQQKMLLGEMGRKDG